MIAATPAAKVIFMCVLLDERVGDHDRGRIVGDQGPEGHNTRRRASYDTRSRRRQQRVSYAYERCCAVITIAVTTSLMIPTSSRACCCSGYQPGAGSAACDGVTPSCRSISSD